MRVVVRQARDDELEAAGEVVGIAYRALPGMDDAGDDRYLAEVSDARGRARDCEVLVAATVDEDVIVGCVSYIAGPESPLAEVAQAGEAEFRMLGVLPGARGSGVGRALVEACVDRAREAGRSALVLSTPPEWAVGQRLYERLGFVPVPSRDHEPVPGAHLLAYVLEL